MATSTMQVITNEATPIEMPVVTPEAAQEIVPTHISMLHDIKRLSFESTPIKSVQPIKSLPFQSTAYIVQAKQEVIVPIPVVEKPVEEKPIPTPKKVEVKPVPKVVKQPTAIRVGATKYSKDAIKKRICEVFGSACAEALIIAEKESNFNPNARSKTNDHGLFQINCKWQGHRVGGNCSKLYDIETNIRIAKKIYDEQKWRPWSTRFYLAAYKK